MPEIMPENIPNERGGKRFASLDCKNLKTWGELQATLYLDTNL